MRYIVIGSGVAGLSAIEAIRSLDPVGEVTMISQDPYGYYSRPGLAYYLTGELTDKMLYPRSRADYKKLNFSFMHKRVQQLLPSEHTIELEGGARQHYDRLLLALGARSLPLRVPGSNLFGVVKLDDFADAKNILKITRKGKTAVVVGGGITALELVEGLLARGMKVHYLLRGSRYWSSVLDERESRTVQGCLQAQGVNLHFQSQITQINGRNGRIASISLAGGKILPCDLLAYAIGVSPHLELAQQAGIACQRGILVDQYLHTDQPDIYAAGDVAQVFDPLSGRLVLDTLWHPARQQGWTAGLNMAGQPIAYQKSPPINVTRLAGLTTTIIGMVGCGQDDDIAGIARGDSETWRDLPHALVAQGGFDINHLRLMVGEKTLLGAVVMGDQTLSLPLQKIISAGVDITPIRARLLAPEAPLSDLIADAWLSWSNRSS